jgi:outer membrane protein assembly complex protein YaeT
MKTRVFVRLLACLFLVFTTACKEESGVQVKSFKFNGTNAVTEAQLKSVLATSASSKIPWGTKRYFSREQFEADLKRIVAFYKDRGFPDAKVTNFDVKLSDDQTAVDISLQISEGEPVTVERVVFEGFEPLPAEHRTSLENNLPLRPGQPLDRALMQASREAALDELRDHGFPYASVRLSEEPGSSERQRLLVLRAAPGVLAHYGDIQISGNRTVSDDVVRRQLVVRPGRPFRQSALQASQRRLYRQELFEFANVEVVRDEGQPAEVPIRVTVNEGKHQRVNFSVGYGSEERARTEVDYRHVNFFGGARTAGVHARYSGLDRGVRLSLNQPYLFSPRYSITLTGQSWWSDEPAFDLTNNGGRLTVTRQFAGRTRAGSVPVINRRASTTLALTYAHEFEDYTISNAALEDLTFRNTLIALGLDPRTGEGRGTRSAIMLDGGRNTTDNAVDARRGYVASVHFERAGQWLSGTYDYFETTLEGRYYQSVGPVVLAVRGTAGSIDGVGDQEASVPFFKRFFLGGATNLRGWGRYDVSPLSGAGLPIGGASSLLMSAEVRVPVWRALSGVVFVDAGNVWTNPWEFNTRDLRYDIGPGLRYTTPIGPIRADLGYQLNRIEGLLINGEPEARRFRFHFSIGQAF